jgi:hypothetical protein
MDLQKNVTKLIYILIEILFRGFRNCFWRYGHNAACAGLGTVSYVNDPHTY